MISGADLFVIGLSLVLSVVIYRAFGFKPAAIKRYFTEEKAGKQAFAGIKMFTVAAVLIVLGMSFCSKAEAAPSITIDVAALQPYSGKSIFCREGSPDNKTTAYGAVQINVIERDGFLAYARLEHHQSCAINQDAQTFDGFGVGFSYTIPLFPKLFLR